jgi:hypothetical protein
MNRQPVTIPVSSKLRVIDISMGGVLFECEDPVTIGTRGTLRLNLGRIPFVVELQVLRVSPVAPVAPRNVPAYRVAGSYVNLSPVHRGLIDRFISV